MACSKRSARMAGIAKHVPPPSLVGVGGFVLIEHMGKHPKTFESMFTDAVYVFQPSTQRYVDAQDASRIKAWRENGVPVMVEVSDASLD